MAAWATQRSAFAPGVIWQGWPLSVQLSKHLKPPQRFWWEVISQGPGGGGGARPSINILKLKGLAI